MRDAVIKAAFVNSKPVQGRAVTQLIFEVPIEMGLGVLNTLGYPQPDKDIWVAIARLNDEGTEG